MAETGKKRSVRIPLDYFKRPDPFTYWKLGFTLVGVVIATGWALGLGWDFWRPAAWADRSRQLASHGPLARVHATWEAECQACHAPFRPIGQAAWVEPILGDSRKSDAQCQSCHAGPVHHSSQEPENLACASCHHDHLGRDASLVRIGDQHCTQCHSDLSLHVKEDRAPLVSAKVVRFDDDKTHHPEFRALREQDPGRLKFDHARHLTAGMATKTSGPIQRLAQLAEPDRARYQVYAKGSDGTIQLDCAACHRIEREDTDLPTKTPLSRSDGLYMLPVTYEKNCRACHPLDYDPGDPSLVMAHPLQPAEVHESLRETYVARYLADDPSLLNERIPPRPVPGHLESPELKAAREAIDRKVRNAEKLLFGAKKCAECHDYQATDRSAVASLERWEPAREVRVTPTTVPGVWFRSALFAHSAHRTVNCRECHESAYPDGQKPSHQSGDVMLPSIKICTDCHGPRSRGSVAGTMRGGASFDCTECHRYHNADSPLQGPGATARGVQDPGSIRAFLLGTRAPRRP